MAKRIVKNAKESRQLQVSNVFCNQSKLGFFFSNEKYSHKTYTHKIPNILGFFYISRTTPYNKVSKSLHPTYHPDAASLYF